VRRSAHVADLRTGASAPLSAIIRYEGAEKDENGEVVEDTIAVELKALLRNRESVTPGAVYVTGAGALGRTRGVKKIFHAASVYGVPGSGFQVIQEVERCVTTALHRMDHEQYKDCGLRTIVFPMLGSGVAGGQVGVIAPRLLQAAISYFRSCPESAVSTVYFSAWNHHDLEACLAALGASKEVENVPG
jgi:O-acetyl-ADP-ribose deacetylase (regulator of RNase III)